MIVSAIVMAARDAAADIEDASTGESLTPERARALKTLANNLYATAFQAEENDSVRVPRDDGHPFQLIVGSDSTR